MSVSDHEYYLKNKEKIKLRSNLYRKANRERVLIAKRLWHQKNRDIILKKQKLYYQTHKETFKERQKLWNEKNKDKIKNYRKQYGKKYNVENNFRQFWRRIELPERNRERQKKYYKQNQEKIIGWRTKNREVILEKQKQCYRKNKKKYLKKMKEYYKKNKDKRIKHARLWAKKNPQKRFKILKNALKKIALPYDMKLKEVSAALKTWSYMVRNTSNNTCQICNDKAIYAHHLFYKSYYPKLAFNLNNGIALCHRCHWEIHGTQPNKIKPLEPRIDVRRYAIMAVNLQRGN